MEIERPRSALHSGDFREEKEHQKADHGSSSSAAALATSPVAPWHHSFPAAVFSPGCGRSPSYASPFVFMPTTSPLVHQSNNTDLDFSSRPQSRQTSRSPDGNKRRHTFSPPSFQSFQSSSMAGSATGTPAARHLRREGTFPYQAHQPRRSLTSLNHFQPHGSPPTPFNEPRRPSVSEPLHHAPMVGSYEESILRGRMSTAPSRPLNFVAQIGVLGKGECRSDLRCPPHVTVPFPAVFYSYSGGNGRIADDSPSPYVGLIDLENTLSRPEESSEPKRKRRHTVPNPDQDGITCAPSPRDEPPPDGVRRREKKKRRSTSPKAPPGGSYRIPQQGQLQIVIKNPNKTAVKLFLVPYDLSDMEPGQKTFVRQRSYSAGPIIDMPLSSRKNLGTDRPEAALSNSDDPNDRPILRYLIHLHICCPSKGRYYLHKSVRVVFANRVPDGKEKLRNETQLPEPRYSTYKPARDLTASQPISSAAAQLTAEKALRRSSAGFSLSQHAYDSIDGLAQRPPLPPPAIQFTGGESSRGSLLPAFGSIPFNISPKLTDQSKPYLEDAMEIDTSPFWSRPKPSSPTTPGSFADSSSGTFGKLKQGDVGYGGVAGPVSPCGGLLAQRLRGLDVQPDADHDADHDAGSL
jgi:hypothetical protein